MIEPINNQLLFVDFFDKYKPVTNRARPKKGPFLVLKSIEKPNLVLLYDLAKRPKIKRKKASVTKLFL